MTSPPTILTNGAMNTNEGCATIADAAGNLLFYTDGLTVWNQNHVAMGNGTGLTGHSSTSQSGIIVKQPGNTNIYFVFTLGVGPSGSLNYSIVDMTLAAGIGSVTTKNVLVATNNTEKLTSVRHCNGVDFWVVAHENNSDNYRAFLVSSTGVNTVPVVSAIGSSGNIITYYCMKLSPNGRKLGATLGTGTSYELFDFDNSTGVVSNSLSLPATGAGSPYGCEFSPDGTKFYGATLAGKILQWDLCAGTNTAIIASQYTVYAGPGTKGALQTGPDGKIYVARTSTSMLGVVNNPNASGSACNYVDNGQSIAPKVCVYGLPNFITSGFKPPPPPFTFTVSNSYGCQGAAFTMPPTINTSTVIGCVASGYSVVGQTWIFGDPASGAANTSTLNNPIHAYTTLGTYTAMLVINYSCGGGTDTIKQPININQPCISVNSTSITCAHLGSATVAATGGIGPFSYTWMPTAQANSVATGLSPGSYTLTVFDFGNNFTYTATTQFTSLIPLTGTLTNSSGILCNGANTGSASVTNLAGGSGTVSYLWYNTITSYTTPFASSLGAGIWSVTVTDVLTGCQINDLFYIAQPPPMSLVLSSNSPTTCAATTVSLSGLNSGGTPHLLGPAYTYSWTGGPATTSRTVSQVLAGTYVYSLTSRDSLNCAITETIAIDFIANPVLSISHVSICPLQTGTLNVSGASSYTWSNNTTGSTYTDNPLSNTQYTVSGSALGCTSIATASIILKPVPIPLLNSNSPICNGQNLNLFGNGGTSYQWSGPLGYSSSQQNPVLNTAAPNNSGVYTLTVTAANSCTASVNKTITVNPTPSLSAGGSTVCVNQTMNLFASSLAGSSYLWTGPNSYTSNLQNPFITNPAVNRSGSYTVKVTSAVGCTNTASADVSVTAMPVPTLSSTSPKCYGKAINFVAAGAISYQWSGPNGFSSGLQNPNIAFVTLGDGGVYNLQLTTGPCVTTATLGVIVFPLPSFTMSSNSPCETKSLSLNASNVPNAVSWLWTGPAGFGNQFHNTGRDSSILAYAGVYTLTVIDANTCQNTATLGVTVRQNPTLTPISTTVCLNQPATLKVSGAASYVWSGPHFYQSNQASALIPHASNVPPTTYTVVGTAVNGCTTETKADITTMSLPVPALSVNPANRLCLNKTFILEGYGGMGYEWHGENDLHYSGKTVSITASSPIFEGTYTLVVSDEKGCQSSTTTAIIIDPLPIGSILADKQKSCVPFHSQISFTSSAQSYSTIICSWILNNKTYSTTYSTKNFSTDVFTLPGTYTLSGLLTDTIHYCTNTVSMLIEGYEVPRASFDLDPKVPVEDEQILFTNTSKGEEQSKWSWFFRTSKVDSSKKEHPVYSFNQSGSYPVVLVVKNKWGCEDTTIRLIKIDQDLTIYIPNAFTPNGDGLNDEFVPVLRGIRLYNLQIFNRWGTKLFETSDPNQGWAGHFNDKPCKNDVYVWKMNITTLKGDMKTLTGTVLLGGKE